MQQKWHAALLKICCSNYQKLTFWECS